MSNAGEWKFVIENWDNLLKNDKKTIIRTLRIGIPDKYRKIVWSLLTESKKVKEKTDFSFNYMLELPSSSEDIINCDVPRTFSMDVKNRDSRMVSLKDVLIAYSNADPGIGYVQGMNFVAGMFVCYQDTETAFWSFYSLMQRSHRDLFVDQFKHLRELGVVITHALERKLPKVHQKFEELEISPLLYSPIWFNSCFIPAELDQELTLFLFDEYLAFGETILLSFGLTMLSLNQDVLFNQDLSDFLSVLTCPGRAKIMHNRQRINMEWANMWVTNKEFDELKKIYLNNPDEVLELP